MRECLLSIFRQLDLCWCYGGYRCKPGAVGLCYCCFQRGWWWCGGVKESHLIGFTGVLEVSFEGSHVWATGGVKGCSYQLLFIRSRGESWTAVENVQLWCEDVTHQYLVGTNRLRVYYGHVAKIKLSTKLSFILAIVGIGREKSISTTPFNAQIQPSSSSPIPPSCFSLTTTALIWIVTFSQIGALYASQA